MFQKCFLISLPLFLMFDSAVMSCAAYVTKTDKKRAPFLKQIISDKLKDLVTWWLFVDVFIPYYTTRESLLLL